MAYLLSLHSTIILKEGSAGFKDLLGQGFNEAKASVIERFSAAYLRNILTQHRGNVTNVAGPLFGVKTL